jgi:hypothetical protein
MDEERTIRASENHATPTRERCVTSYPARRNDHPYTQFPPKAVNPAKIVGVELAALRQAPSLAGAA